MASKKKAKAEVVEPKVSKADAKEDAVVTMIGRLKQQNSEGHRVTHAQLDELEALVRG